MKNRAIKSVIAAATSLALLGSGVAVAQDTNNSAQTQSADASSSSDSKDKLVAGEGKLPHFEINGKEATGFIAIVAALNVAIEVIGKILEGALSLVEGFQKLAPKPAEEAK